MAEESQDGPTIQVRAGQETDKEEEERKKGGAVLPSGGGHAPGLIRGGAGLGGAAEGLGGAAAEVHATARSAGLLSRLLGRLADPFKSLSGFFRQLAALGPAEGLKFALRNVVVQGMLAGLALALAVGLFVKPPSGSSGDGTGANPFPISAIPTADAARGEGLLGSIPGIYDKVMGKLRGEEPPAEVAKADEAAKKEEPAAEPPPTPDAGPTADPEARGVGNAAFNIGRLEKLASLSGQGGGAGGGGGSISAFPTASGKGGSPGGGAAGPSKVAASGKLDALKRGRVAIRGGGRQGVLGARNARGQLDNAKIASGLGAGSSNPQTGAAMAALPFDGAPITGPGASNAAGGGIVPLPGSGLPGGGGPGPSNNNGGDPTGPDDDTDGPDGPDDPDVPRTGPTRNVTPYQALLNKAASLVGAGQRAVSGAKKWKWAAIACFAIAGLIAWGGRGLKGKQKKVSKELLAARSEVARNREGLKLLYLAKARPDANIKLIESQIEAGEKILAVNEKAEAALSASVQAGTSGGFIAAMGAAIAIAGIGMTFLGMYRNGMEEGQAKLDEAQEIANEIQDKYDQQEQAQIVRNAANADCTKDGKPLVKDPDACGYRPDLNTFGPTGNELQAFIKCMAPPVCPRSTEH